MSDNKLTIKSLILNSAKKITHARQNCGSTLKDIALLLGISSKSLQRIEGGELQPTLPELESLTFLLNLPFSSLSLDQENEGCKEVPDANKLQQLMQLRDKVIGATLKLKRQNLKLSVKELSSRSKIPVSLIKRYEFGKASIPLDELEALCTILQIDAETLINKHSPIGIWHREQKRTKDFATLPDNMQEFISNPENIDFIQTAMDMKNARIDNPKSILESMNISPMLNLEED